MRNLYLKLSMTALLVATSSVWGQTGSSQNGQVLYNNNNTVAGAPASVGSNNLGIAPGLTINSYAVPTSPITAALTVPYPATSTSSHRAIDLLPSDTTKAPFGFSEDATLFNSTYDNVARLGYNCGFGGGNLMQSEPRFCFTVEQDYDQGTSGNPNHVLESYFEFSSINSTIRYRPIFWQFDRQTGNMNRFTLSTLNGGGIGFTDAQTDAEWGVISPLYIQSMGYPSQQGDTQLVLNAQNGYAGSIFLAGNFSIFRVASDQWQIKGCSNCSLYARTNNQWAFGQQNFAGTVTIQTPTNRATADPTLALVQAGGQTTPYLVALDSTGHTQFQVSAAGNTVVGAGTDDKTDKLQVNGSAKITGGVTFGGVNTTGSKTPGWGANCPAASCAAPYTWVQVKTADGSTGYIPVFK